MRTVVIGEPQSGHIKMFEACADALGACEEAMIPGKTAGDVFDATARIMDDAGLNPHRLNACGVLSGRKVHAELDGLASASITATMPRSGENMVFFAHMILMDSDSGTAMTLGQSYITADKGPESLSKLPVEMLCK